MFNDPQVKTTAERSSYLSWRSPPTTLEERIAIASRENLHLEPNCYGTAFFLLGALPYDMVIFTGKGNVARALKQMRPISAPVDHSIIAMGEGNSIGHLAYVQHASSGKLLGYHREGACGPFKKFETLQECITYMESCKPYPSFFSKPKEPSYNFSYYALKEGDTLETWARDIVAQYHPGWDG